MSLPIYLWQDTRKDGTNLWYGSATHLATAQLDDLAEEVQENCSLKKSDCLAVNKELLSVIKTLLAYGNCVYLDNFGFFKPCVNGKGALNKDDYSPAECVKRVSTNFVACYGFNKGGKGKVKTSPWTKDVKYMLVAAPFHSN